MAKSWVVDREPEASMPICLCFFDTSLQTDNVLDRLTDFRDRETLPVLLQLPLPLSEPELDLLRNFFASPDLIGVASKVGPDSGWATSCYKFTGIAGP